jgi:transitional endoplasmic reticulum ATPase
MDDQTFDGLRSALAASPDNVKLRCLVLRELVARGETTEARDVVDRLLPSSVSDQADRSIAAEASLLVGKPERALDFLEGESAVTLLLRARAFAALGRATEAKALYQRAVEQNPALEDLELKRTLGASVREVSVGPGRPALRVIANDDTSMIEIHRLIAPEQDKVTFADVGGLDEVKKQITRKIILPYKKPSIFQRFKRRTGGGILLYGPPGCGKTLLARATAGECDAAFFNIAISDVLDMYIGESERKLHALFENARSKAPAILFFDELEALAGKRQFSREGTSAKLVSQFLSEMDGFAQNNAGVLILGATNVPWAVDPAFRRPGRFDRMLFIPPPDLAAREQILRHLLAERPTAGDVSPSEIAKKTSGFSGADLKNLIESAVDEAIEQSLTSGNEVPVSREHVARAQKEVSPTTLDWLTTARNYARYANESGQYDEVLAFLDRHGKS